MLRKLARNMLPVSPAKALSQSSYLVSGSVPPSVLPSTLVLSWLILAQAG